MLIKAKRESYRGPCHRLFRGRAGSSAGLCPHLDAGAKLLRRILWLHLGWECRLGELNLWNSTLLLSCNKKLGLTIVATQKKKQLTSIVFATRREARQPFMSALQLESGHYFPLFTELDLVSCSPGVNRSSAAKTSEEITYDRISIGRWREMSSATH
jgi:hypothetical protein